MWIAYVLLLALLSLGLVCCWAWCLSALLCVIRHEAARLARND